MKEKKKAKNTPAYLADRAREAYECLRSQLGDEHIMTLMMKHTLASYLERCENYEELYEISKGFSEEALSRSDEINEIECLEMAKFPLLACIATGRYAEATQIGSVALPVIRKKFSHMTMDIAGYVLLLSEGYTKQGLFSESEKLLKKMISDMDREEEDITNPTYYMSVINRAGVLNAMGKVKAASSTLREFIKLLSLVRKEAFMNIDHSLQKEMDPAYVDLMSASIAREVASHALSLIGDGSPFDFSSIAESPAFAKHLHEQMDSAFEDFEDLLDSLSDESFIPYPDEE